MVLYRDREFSFTTEVARASVAIEILCCDRARGLEGQGVRDRVFLGHDRVHDSAQQYALCARQNAQRLRQCVQQRAR